MRHDISIRQSSVEESRSIRQGTVRNEDIVLEKSIFSNIFDKDIRRVFIYKKAERLANALGLITPAFHTSPSLSARAESLALALTETAARSPATFRDALARELLSLSSVLSLARTAGLLSPMNAELITAEAHALLKEVTSYEEPQLTLPSLLSLATIARNASSASTPTPSTPAPAASRPRPAPGAVNDISRTFQGHSPGRRERIVSLIGEKGTATIRDLSTMIRGVSEKTIQRELLILIEGGQVVKRGERRWSTYTLT